ncbi:MAG: DUF4349 domain-containing protein [Peptococcaceae bacterium]|nr:DUF4349 domain-containing protein [Peptococcaceae bacterium]
MTKQEQLLRLWEQDGDLAMIRKFFAASTLSESNTKERIKQITLAKLEQAQSSDTKGQSGMYTSPHLTHPGRAGQRRWGWKLVLPAAALVLVVLLGQTGLPTANGPGHVYGPTVKSSVHDMAQSAQNMVGGVTKGVDYQSAANSSGAIGVLPPLTNPPPADPNLAHKITRNMNASLQVANVPSAVDKLNNLATTLGGYTVNSQLDNQTDNSTAMAQVTLKIPSGKFAGMQDSLAAIGKVLSENINAEDITNQYYDTSTRLKDWQAEEQRYLEIMQQAKTVDDIVKVESALNNIRLQIEQLKGQLKLWDNQVAYSTIQVQLQTTPNPVKVNEPWQPIAWHTTWQAAQDAVLKTVSVAWNSLNYLVVGIGYLLPLGLVAGLGYWGYRRWRKRQ